MAKLIGLVGHCGPDAYMLRSAVKYAVKDAEVRMLNDDEALRTAIESTDAVLLVNRQIDGDFPTYEGVELIRALKASHPNVRTMLVSNYADAQAAAVAAGALEGFGKSEIGSSKMKERLAAAI